MPQPTINTPRETTHQRIADALEDIVDKIVDTSSASNVNYDNAQSGLSANKVQGAVDELASEKADKSTTLAGYGITDAYTKAEVYTQSEVNNIVSTLETNIDWKEAVNTYSDIATTYPNPQDGWTVNVKDTDYTYRYNGSEWVAISANAIPEATTSVKGLMTPTQVSKLNGIEAGAQVNTVTSVAGKTGTVTLTKSDVGLGNVDNTSDLDKPISTAVQTALNSKVDKVAGKGLSTNDYTNEEKQKNADNASAIEDIQEDISTSQTATGNPLTIESSESNLVECVAEVECVQEGSGDPSPTNIRPIIGQTEVVIEDVGKNWFKYNKTDSQNAVSNKIPWKDGLKFKYFGDTAISSGSIALRCYDGFDNELSATVLAYFISAGYQADLSVTTGTKYIRFTSYRTTASGGIDDYINAQFMVSDDVTTYEPYKDKTYRVEIGQKNKLPPFTSTTVQGVTITVNAQGVVTLNGTATGTGSINIGVSLKAGTYKISGAYGNSDFYKSETMGNNNRMYIYDGSSSYFDNVSGGREFTLSQDTTCTVYLVYVSGYTFNNSVIYPMIRTTIDDSEFVPYNPNLPDAIYGGELDVLTGESKVAHGEVDLGSLTWTYEYGAFRSNSINSLIARPINDNTVPNVLTPLYKPRAWIDSTDMGVFVLPQSSSYTKYLTITDSRYTDPNVFKSAMSGVQLVYELAEPYTIQLTPEQIRLLKGTNHLSCNTGDLSIKYYPDNVLGQLKGDIEDEYDDRIETLETQMVERPQLKRYSTRLLCDGFSSKNISITTDKKIIPLFARFDAEYMELYVDYEPRFYNPLVYYDDGKAYIKYQTSGIPNDNQQRTFEMYYYEV